MFDSLLTFTAIQMLAKNSPPLDQLCVALRENKLQVPQEDLLSKRDNNKKHLFGFSWSDHGRGRLWGGTQPPLFQSWEENMESTCNLSPNNTPGSSQKMLSICVLTWAKQLPWRPPHTVSTQSKDTSWWISNNNQACWDPALELLIVLRVWRVAKRELWAGLITSTDVHI